MINMKRFKSLFVSQYTSLAEVFVGYAIDSKTHREWKRTKERKKDENRKKTTNVETNNTILRHHVLYLCSVVVLCISHLSSFIRIDCIEAWKLTSRQYTIYKVNGAELQCLSSIIWKHAQVLEKFSKETNFLLKCLEFSSKFGFLRIV